MADLSDPEINKAFIDVKAGKLGWMALGHVPRSDTKYKVAATGAGGFAEVEDQLNDGKVLFFFIGQDLSGVKKFVLICYCGEGVTGMKKGLYNNHSQDMIKFFKGAHVTIHARNENDVKEADVMKRIKTSAGASFHVQHAGQNTESTPQASGITYEKRDYDQSTENKPSASTISYDKRDGDQSTENKPSASSITYDKGRQDQSTENNPKPSTRAPPPSAGGVGAIKRPGAPGSAPSSAPAPAPVKPAPAPSRIPPPAASSAPPKAAPPPAAPPKAAPPPPKPAPPPVQPEPEPEPAYEEPAQETYEEQPQESYDEQPQESYEEQPAAEGRSVKALYDYGGENETDLVFKEGDIITVIDDTDPSGWWEGELNGVRGSFPSNFVE